ncbi:MAG: hypothetical protein U0T82_02520 [Bacteroidales bacterium]
MEKIMVFFGTGMKFCPYIQKKLPMYKWLLIGLVSLFLCGCASSNNSSSSKRSLMLIDMREQPRNAKFSSPKYQAKMKKNQKHNRRENHRSYKRASR